MASIYKRGKIWWLDVYRGKNKPRIRLPIGPDRRIAERLLNAYATASGPDALERLAQRLREESRSLPQLRDDFLAACVGVSVVRDLAGHSSIAVTDGYAHTETEHLRAAIGRL